MLKTILEKIFCVVGAHSYRKILIMGEKETSPIFIVKYICDRRGCNHGFWTSPFLTGMKIVPGEKTEDRVILRKLSPVFKMSGVEVKTLKEGEDAWKRSKASS
jgi:hypothetical protein